MRKWIVLALLLPSLAGAAVGEAATGGGTGNNGDTSLKAAFEAALWPADIVRAADAYLAAHPEAADASEVAAQRRTAAEVAQLLRAKDVLVFRSSFRAEQPEQLRDLRLAALGDRAAAVRLAEASRAHDETHGTRRYVGWMQLASMLRDAAASYQLALHFRRSGQPLLAAHYEAVALALGHEPPAALDNRRK